jgi:hypothetical protein
MELIATWRTSFTLRFVPVTFAQVLFSAGTIFLLSAVQASAGMRLASQALNHSRSQAGLCIKYLSEIGQSWNCANNIGGILSNLLQVVERLVGQRADQRRRRASSASTSPNTFASRPSDRTGIPIPGTSPGASRPIDTGLSISPEDHFNNEPLPFHPTLNQGFDFGGQQFGVDQFVDVLGVGGNFTDADGGAVGAAFAFSGFGGGMPGGHTLSSQPFVPVGITAPSSDGGAFQSTHSLQMLEQQSVDEKMMYEQFWTQQH